MKRARHLINWGFVAVDGHGPVLAGLQGTSRDEEEVRVGARVSTPIVEYDHAAGTALTATHRPYVLHGPEQPDRALEAFLSLYSLPDGSDVQVIPPADVPDVIRRNGNAFFKLSAPEEAEQRADRLDEIARDLRGFIGMLDRLHGMDAVDLAEEARAPLFEVQALLEGVPSESMNVPAAEAIVEVAQRLLNEPDTRGRRKP